MPQREPERLPSPSLQGSGFLGWLVRIGLGLKLLLGLLLLGAAAFLWQRERAVAELLGIFGVAMLLPLLIWARSARRGPTAVWLLLVPAAVGAAITGCVGLLSA